jgi:hypothetical protein
MSGTINIGGVQKNISSVSVNVGGVWKNVTKLSGNIGGAWKDGWTSGIGGIDAYAKLMLHMNGSNGSTTFTDSSLSPKTVSAFGNTQISTTQYKFGGASGYFDGTGDYLTIPDQADLQFGTGDFTIDFWFRYASGYPALISKGYNTAGINGNWGISINSLYKISFDALDGTSGLQSVKGNTALSANTFYHIAIVRNSGTLKIYVNGVEDGSGAVSKSLVASTAVLIIGSNGVSNLNGYMDELRISKGIARWTSNFTPPTSEYTV